MALSAGVSPNVMCVCPPPPPPSTSTMFLNSPLKEDVPPMELLFGYPKANFGPLLRGQPHLTILINAFLAIFEGHLAPCNESLLRSPLPMIPPRILKLSPHVPYTCGKP